MNFRDFLVKLRILKPYGEKITSNLEKYFAENMVNKTSYFEVEETAKALFKTIDIIWDDTAVFGIPCFVKSIEDDHEMIVCSELVKILKLNSNTFLLKYKDAIDIKVFRKDKTYKIFYFQESLTASRLYKNFVPAMEDTSHWCLSLINTTISHAIIMLCNKYKKIKHL